MRARWRLLFWVSLASLIGLSWVAQAFGASLLGLMTLPVLGMIAGCTTAFVAMIHATDQRWPAWVVLVCWLPQGTDLVQALGFLPLFMERAGAGAVLFFAGAAATLFTAVWIGLAPVRPPPKDDPIARAELR